MSSERHDRRLRAASLVSVLAGTSLWPPSPAEVERKAMALNRRLLALALTAVTTLASATLMVLTSASRADAATAIDPSQFHGVHWSRLGDNFTADRLVLQGLSANDDYNAARGKADAMFAAFAGDLGANTVRLPINPATTS